MHRAYQVTADSQALADKMAHQELRDFRELVGGVEFQDSQGFQATADGQANQDIRDLAEAV